MWHPVGQPVHTLVWTLEGDSGLLEVRALRVWLRLDSGIFEQKKSGALVCWRRGGVAKLGERAVKQVEARAKGR